MDTQLSQWEREGYLIVERAYEGDDLLRLQAAFDRCAAEAKPEWLDAVEAGTKTAAYFDIPDPLRKDDAFIDLADHPGYFGLLQELLGEDLFFEGAQVRTLPQSRSVTWAGTQTYRTMSLSTLRYRSISRQFPPTAAPLLLYPAVTKRIRDPIQSAIGSRRCPDMCSYRAPRALPSSSTTTGGTPP